MMLPRQDQRSLYQGAGNLYGARLVVFALTAALATSMDAQDSRKPPECDPAPEQLPQLTLLAVHTGHLEPGAATCFALRMQKGEFVRGSFPVDKGYLRLRVLEPRTRNSLVVTWGWGREWGGQPPALFAFEAPTSGVYLVELSVPVMSWSSAAGPFSLQIDESLSAKAQADRRAQLRADPRTAWLREHAIPVRSLDPADQDFSDLEFMREQLRGVRVVLLGEGSPGHGGGSEQYAKARLVKFLHRELGFDVLAFEGGMFGHSVAWRALQSGEEPRTAFLKGQYRNAALSSHVQPLIEYLAEAARTQRPLELVGFDSEFSGTAPRDSLLPSLREFLARTGIQSSLADSSGGPSRIFASIIDGSFRQRRGQLVRPAEKPELALNLRTTAAQIEKTVSGRDGLFWAQVLRSAAMRVDRALDGAPSDAGGEGAARDRQMGENLVWLAKTYFPDRKIIVWAHTLHVMRNPQYTTPGRDQGFTMGHSVWEALGKESFVIGTTAYDGAFGCVLCTEGMAGFRQDITTDQHPSFEFEELMNAAGHELAWVNLRTARVAGSWLGGAFLARPVAAATERAPWPEVMDAVFFIRTQEPNKRVAEVRR